MDDLRARTSFQRDIRDCNILCLSETWLTPSVPDTAVTPSDKFSVLRMDRTAEAGKIKGGGVCSWLTRNGRPQEYLHSVAFLLASSGTSLHYLPPILFTREFSAVIATAVYIPPQADTSLALSKLHEELSGYITNTLTLPLSSQGTLTKPTSGRSCRTSISMYPVQPEDRIHWIIATLSSRMPIKLVPYQPSGSQTTRPFSSHRNINKGSFRNPRGRGKWRAVLPLWSYATGVSWWRRLGHVPGEFSWRQRVHGCSIKLCQHANRPSHWNGNNKDIL